MRRDTASSSANTCCLTPISSKTASMTKSAPAKLGLVQRAGDQALGDWPRPADAALGQQLVDLRVDLAHPLVDPLLVMSVSTTGTSRRRANSSASCEAIRPAPTTPTLVTGRASDLSGAPAGRLPRFCARLKA